MTLSCVASLGVKVLGLLGVVNGNGVWEIGIMGMRWMMKGDDFALPQGSMVSEVGIPFVNGQPGDWVSVDIMFSEDVPTSEHMCRSCLRKLLQWNPILPEFALVCIMRLFCTVE
ncbi:hypothetical protein Tco_0960594 [Tanacetum coccineum]